MVKKLSLKHEGAVLTVNKEKKKSCFLLIILEKAYERQMHRVRGKLLS